MDLFEQIEQHRLAHGYASNDLLKYKRFCNKQARGRSKKEDITCLLHKLESNLSKFLLLNAPSFLYKNRRLLRNTPAGSQSPEFTALYMEYTQCFIDSVSGSVSFEALCKLRKIFTNFYTFSNDVYLIDKGNHDFSEYKIDHKWHDVTLVFETPRMRDSFTSGSFIVFDNRFNSQLAFLVTKVERDKGKLLSSISDENGQLMRIFNNSKEFLSSVERLFCFLNDNFLESEYVKRLEEDTETLHEYIAGLVAFRNGNLEAGNRNLPKLVCFKDEETQLAQLDSHKKVSEMKLREIILEHLDRHFKVKEENRKMPLLPVFYDLAFDYVQYPEKKEGISGLFKHFSFFKRK